MDAKLEFRARWERAVVKHHLSRGTSDAYWSWVKKLFVVCGRRGSAHWTGRDWERLEWWIAEQIPTYSWSSRQRIRRAASPLRPQISGAGPRSRLAMALRLLRGRAAASLVSLARQLRHRSARSAPSGRHRQAHRLPLPAQSLCQRSTAGRHGYSHHPGAPRPRSHGHHRDPLSANRSARRLQSRRYSHGPASARTIIAAWRTPRTRRLARPGRGLEPHVRQRDRRRKRALGQVMFLRRSSLGVPKKQLCHLLALMQ